MQSSASWGQGGGTVFIFSWGILFGLFSPVDDVWPLLTTFILIHSILFFQVLLLISYFFCSLQIYWIQYFIGRHLLIISVVCIKLNLLMSRFLRSLFASLYVSRSLLSYCASYLSPFLSFLDISLLPYTSSSLNSYNACPPVSISPKVLSLSQMYFHIVLFCSAWWPFSWFQFLFVLAFVLQPLDSHLSCPLPIPSPYRRHYCLLRFSISLHSIGTLFSLHHALLNRRIDLQTVITYIPGRWLNYNVTGIINRHPWITFSDTIWNGYKNSVWDQIRFYNVVW